MSIPYNRNPKSSEDESFSLRRGRPMLFQVTDPLTNTNLYPTLLALHVNPENFNESMRKSKSVAMTRGGFVEWVWPDDLDTISASGTTGAFIGPQTGLTAGSDININGVNSGRKRTIAYERQEDLLDLFRMNGAIFNSRGQPVLRGQIMCIYDRGIFTGHFSSFKVAENDESAFSFKLDWEFTVENTVYKYPNFKRNYDPVRSAAANATSDSDTFVVSGSGLVEDND